MPRRTPVYRGTANEMRERLFEMDGEMAELRQEIGSLFELVLENRSRLDALESAKRVPRARGSRKSRRARRNRSR